MGYLFLTISLFAGAASYPKNCGVEQMEIYPKIHKITYKCLGVNMWSEGFSIFP